MEPAAQGDTCGIDDQHTTKMLASTIQISNNNPTPQASPHHTNPPKWSGPTLHTSRYDFELRH